MRAATSLQTSPISARRALDQDRRPSVLIVDDVDDNRVVLSMMLSLSDYHVEAVSDAELAIETLRNHHFDLVLMDVTMPVCDGLEATRRIRAMGVAADDMPIIGVTASVGPGAKAACLEAGMQDYLAKPVTLQQLQAIAESWLR